MGRDSGEVYLSQPAARELPARDPPGEPGHRRKGDVFVAVGEPPGVGVRRAKRGLPRRGGEVRQTGVEARRHRDVVVERQRPPCARRLDLAVEVVEHQLALRPGVLHPHERRGRFDGLRSDPGLAHVPSTVRSREIPGREILGASPSRPNGGGFYRSEAAGEDEGRGGRVDEEARGRDPVGASQPARRSDRRPVRLSPLFMRREANGPPGLLISPGSADPALRRLPSSPRHPGRVGRTRTSACPEWPVCL